MRVLTIVSILLTTFLMLYAEPGDIIRTFELEDQPRYGVWGLAYDPEDGNIWACGDDSEYSEFCKFRNDEGHDIIQEWQELEAIYYVYDMAYPYYYEGKDTIVIIEGGYDGPSPVKIYDKENGNLLGEFSESPGVSYGICANYDKETLYASLYCGYYIYRWDGSTWEWFSNSDGYAIGMAYGWERVFVIYDISPPCIKVFDSDGNLEERIKLNDWDGYGVSGLSRGRENISGYNESLYATMYDDKIGYGIICEIEVGDYNTAINSSSVGEIKALFH